MATIQAKGFDEYIRKLNTLTEKSVETMKRTIYPAAGLAANAIQAAANTVPVDDSFVKPGEMQHGIRSDEKDILVSGIGIARHENRGGSVNTRVGFTPGAATIARKVESGRSYLQKYPFIRRAVNGTRAAALAEMERQLKEEIEKIMN